MIKEIYKNSSKKVFLDIYGGTATAVSAKLKRAGLLDVVLINAQVAPNPATPSLQRFETYIGLQYTNKESELDIEWTFTIGTEVSVVTYNYRIVTPYADLQEVKTIFPELNIYTYDQLSAMERRVRMEIEIYCNQSFGREVKTLTAYSDGGRMVRLPERIIRIDAISANGLIVSNPYQVSGSGFGIEWSNFVTGTFYSRPPVSSPVHRFPDRSSSINFLITGEFGYKQIPTPVSEAALILLSDRFCGENEWRDKYMDSIRSGDWRFEFNERTYYGTGNATADTLLKPFRNNLEDWVVI